MSVWYKKQKVRIMVERFENFRNEIIRVLEKDMTTRMTNIVKYGNKRYFAEIA